jgi:hypothetical protein
MAETIDTRTGLISETIDVPVGKKQKVLVPIIRPHPSRALHDGVVLNAIGWTETNASVRPTLRELALGGVAAASITHERSSSPFEVLRAAKLRSDRIAQVVDYLNSEFADVSLTGHSLGGTDVARAIVENELRPPVHIFIASAGLIRGDHLRRVAPGVFKEILRQEQHFRESFLSESQFALESLKTVLKNPALVLKEGVYAANHYTADMIDVIADNGTAVGVVVPLQDSIFPADDVKRSIAGLKVDEIFEINARHNPTYHNAHELAQFIIRFVVDAPNIVARRSSLSLTDAEVAADLFKRND